MYDLINEPSTFDSVARKLATDIERLNARSTGW